MKFEVEAVTRRVSGLPLVSVTREVAKHSITVEVEVKLPGGPTQTTPDGWLFAVFAAE